METLKMGCIGIDGNLPLIKNSTTRTYRLKHQTITKIKQSSIANILILWEVEIPTEDIILILVKPQMLIMDSEE